MSKYKIELTQDSTTRSTTIEAESRRGVEQIIEQVGRLFPIRFASVRITEFEDMEHDKVDPIPRYAQDLDMPRVCGMNSTHFKRMSEGYHGTLSRHGKTIIIVLPFNNESVAKHAEEHIVGSGD